MRALCSTCSKNMVERTVAIIFLFCMRSCSWSSHHSAHRARCVCEEKGGEKESFSGSLLSGRSSVEGYLLFLHALFIAPTELSSQSSHHSTHRARCVCEEKGGVGGSLLRFLLPFYRYRGGKSTQDGYFSLLLHLQNQRQRSDAPRSGGTHPTYKEPFPEVCILQYSTPPRGGIHQLPCKAVYNLPLLLEPRLHFPVGQQSRACGSS